MNHDRKTGKGALVEGMIMRSLMLSLILTTLIPSAVQAAMVCRQINDDPDNLQREFVVMNGLGVLTSNENGKRVTDGDWRCADGRGYTDQNGYVLCQKDYNDRQITVHLYLNGQVGTVSAFQTAFFDPGLIHRYDASIQHFAMQCDGSAFDR